MLKMAITLQRIGIFQKWFQSYRERPPSDHKHRFHFSKLCLQMFDPMTHFALSLRWCMYILCQKIAPHERQFSWHLSNIGCKTKPVGCFICWHSRWVNVFAKLKKKSLTGKLKNVLLSEFRWLNYDGWLKKWQKWWSIISLALTLCQIPVGCTGSQ